MKEYIFLFNSMVIRELICLGFWNGRFPWASEVDLHAISGAGSACSPVDLHAISAAQETNVHI